MLGKRNQNVRRRVFRTPLGLRVRRPIDTGLLLQPSRQRLVAAIPDRAEPVTGNPERPQLARVRPVADVAPEPVPLATAVQVLRHRANVAGVHRGHAHLVGDALQDRVALAGLDPF